VKINKQILGIILGFIAGIIDVIPMIAQGLTWDANLSAFSMWVVIGFFIASVDMKVNAILKGIIIALLVLLPLTFIIGWYEPLSLIPIFIMTIVLGGLLGFVFNKIYKG